MAVLARHLIGFVALLLHTLLDASRSRCALLAENALLRHQLAVLERSVPRPRLAPLQRMVLVALARLTPGWKTVLRVVQPETLLRWHRAGFRALCRWKLLRARASPPRRLPPETIALIGAMAGRNRLWGG
jgi:hypothetical protein